MADVLAMQKLKMMVLILWRSTASRQNMDLFLNSRQIKGWSILLKIILVPTRKKANRSNVLWLKKSVISGMFLIRCS